MIRFEPTRSEDPPPPPGRPADPPVAPAMAPAPEPTPAAGDRRPTPLDPWLDGQPEDRRNTNLLAFALATAQRVNPTTEGIARMRQQADAELAGHAMRYLHNRVEEIRQQAVQERLAGLRQPPGFGSLVLANLLALALAGAMLALHLRHPGLLDSLGTWLGDAQSALLRLFHSLAALVGLTSG